MASSNTPEVVEAEVTAIEADIDIVSAFDRKVSEWEQAAEAEASGREVKEIESPEEYEDAVSARKAVRRAKRKIEQERTEFLRPVKSAVSAMEARMRDAIAPLKALDDAYGKAEEAWQKRARKEREAMLAEAYADFAPMLADMAPYERLRDTYDPSGDWLDIDKIDEDKALELMKYAVGQVSKGYETVCIQQVPDDVMAEIKTEFFSCFNSTEAITRVVERRKQAEAVAAFEAERAAQREPEPEPPAPKVAQPAASAATPKPLDTGSVVTPKELESLKADIGSTTYTPPVPTAPAVIDEVAEVMASPSPGGDVPPFALFAYVSEAQKPQLVAFCKQKGIHGSFKKTYGRRMALVPKEG